MITLGEVLSPDDSGPPADPMAPKLPTPQTIKVKALSTWNAFTIGVVTGFALSFGSFMFSKITKRIGKPKSLSGKGGLGKIVTSYTNSTPITAKRKAKQILGYYLDREDWNDFIDNNEGDQMTERERGLVANNLLEQASRLKRLLR